MQNRAFTPDDLELFRTCLVELEKIAATQRSVDRNLKISLALSFFFIMATMVAEGFTVSFVLRTSALAREKILPRLQKELIIIQNKLNLNNKRLIQDQQQIEKLNSVIRNTQSEIQSRFLPKINQLQAEIKIIQHEQSQFKNKWRQPHDIYGSNCNQWIDDQQVHHDIKRDQPNWPQNDFCFFKSNAHPVQHCQLLAEDACTLQQHIDNDQAVVTILQDELQTTLNQTLSHPLRQQKQLTHDIQAEEDELTALSNQQAELEKEINHKSLAPRDLTLILFATVVAAVIIGAQIYNITQAYKLMRQGQLRLDRLCIGNDLRRTIQQAAERLEIRNYQSMQLEDFIRQLKQSISFEEALPQSSLRLN